MENTTPNIFLDQKSARLQWIWMKINGKSTPGRPESVPGGSGGASGAAVATSANSISATIAGSGTYLGST